MAGLGTLSVDFSRDGELASGFGWVRTAIERVRTILHQCKRGTVECIRDRNCITFFFKVVNEFVFLSQNL